MPVRKTLLLASANVFTKPEYLEALRMERQGIRALLSQAIVAGKVGIEQDAECTFPSLFDLFNQPAYNYSKTINLLHYSGHSSKEGIVLHEVDGGNETVTAERLADFLALQEGLEVVFLNSCCSKSIGEKLLGNKIKAVIETTNVVGDSDAAKFSEYFYQALASGKNLKKAFLSAQQRFEKAENESNDGGIQGKHRYISTSKKEQNEKKCLWNLAYQEEAFVEEWYLVERTTSLFFDDRFTKRVLALVEPNEKHEKYIKAIKGVFVDNNDVLLYTWADLIMSGEKAELANATDAVIVFLTEGFAGFWNGLVNGNKEWLKNKNTLCIGCEGDVADAYNRIKDDLKKEELKVVANEPFTLSFFDASKNLEKIMNQQYKKEICSEILAAYQSSGKILNEEFGSLNFNKQKKIFDSTDDVRFKFGKYNLVLIEGSEHCAQELLIKKIMLYARIERKDKKPYVLSIKSNIKDELTKENLYAQINYTLIAENVDLGADFMSKPISEKIAQKIMQQDLTIILNDVYENEKENCLPVFKEFWAELTKDLPHTYDGYRLSIFIVHKSCKNSKNHWNTNGFKSEPPIFNVLLLDAIEPLNEEIFDAWHATTGEKFPKNHQFSKLIDKEYSSQILKDPYMSKAIGEICAIMKCPEVQSELFKFK